MIRCSIFGPQFMGDENILHTLSAVDDESPSTTEVKSSIARHRISKRRTQRMLQNVPRSVKLFYFFCRSTCSHEPYFDGIRLAISTK